LAAKIVLLSQSGIDGNRFITAWVLLRLHCYFWPVMLLHAYREPFRFKYFPIHFHFGVTALQHHTFPLVMNLPRNVLSLRRRILKVFNQTINDVIKRVGLIVP